MGKNILPLVNEEASRAELERFLTLRGEPIPTTPEEWRAMGERLQAEADELERLKAERNS